MMTYSLDFSTYIAERTKDFAGREWVFAKDLRTGIVRRRAVFQWRDSVRPEAQ
jgi:hypothetical protein